jgi:hypothetical protein
MLRDFLFFLRALGQRWVVLLTGGGIVAIPALLTFIGAKSLPQSVNWLIVGLTLMLAAFFSWRTEWIKAGRWLVNIDFDKVGEICSSRTGPQARKLLRQYFGKRTTVTGTLSNIHESNGPGLFPTYVYLDSGKDDNVRVSVHVFPWNWIFRDISAFPPGSIVTVSGRIVGLSTLWTALSSPELISAELPPNP